MTQERFWGTVTDFCDDFFGKGGILFRGTKQTKPLYPWLLAWCYFRQIADTFPLTHLLRRAFSHHKESHIPFSLCFPPSVPHLGTCRCSYSPGTGQGPTKSSAMIAYRYVLPEYLNGCFWSVNTIFFWELLKEFEVFMPSFFLCGVGLCCLIFPAQKAWTVCDELRLFSFSSFQTGRVQLSARALGEVVLAPGKVHWSDRVHVSQWLWEPFGWVHLWAVHYSWALVPGPQITTWQSKLQKDFCIPWGKIRGCWKSGTVSLCFYRYWPETALIF